MWGAANLPFGAARLAVCCCRHDGPPSGLRGALGHAIPLALLAALAIVAAALAIRLALHGDFARVVAGLPERIRLFLVIGAALTAGCFFAHPNIGYRAVLLVLELPGLLALAGSAAPGRARSLLVGDGDRDGVPGLGLALVPAVGLAGGLVAAPVRLVGACHRQHGGAGALRPG